MRLKVKIDAKIWMFTCFFFLFTHSRNSTFSSFFLLTVQSSFLSFKFNSFFLPTVCVPDELRKHISFFFFKVLDLILSCYSQYVSLMSSWIIFQSSLLSFTFYFFVVTYSMCPWWVLQSSPASTLSSSYPSFPLLLLESVFFKREKFKLYNSSFCLILSTFLHQVVKYPSSTFLFMFLLKLYYQVSYSGNVNHKELFWEFFCLTYE